MLVRGGLGGTGQTVYPFGGIGFPERRQWQGPDLARSDVIGDVAPAPSAGCLVDPRQVVRMVGAPAGHREALGRWCCCRPDLQRFGGAGFVGQRLESHGLGVEV